MSETETKNSDLLTPLADAALRAFARVGVPEGERARLLGTYASETRAQEFAAFRWALERRRAANKKVDDISLGYSRNGHHWTFTVDETLELDVDYRPSPEELIRRMSSWKGTWKYVGTVPKAVQCKVKAAIGHLNGDWTEDRLGTLLAKTGCPLKGSGAWVREAFLAVRPNYDGDRPIAFPDAETSRWEHSHDGPLYQHFNPHLLFPLIGEKHNQWERSMFGTGSQWSEWRICLLYK